MSMTTAATEQAPADALLSRHTEDALYSRVTLRWIPFLVLCYIAAYLDRANVGFAKLTMMSDLGLSNTVYGLGAGIFFVGYFFFEVPSNVLMHRFGARRWIARIMLTWGVLSGAMIFVKGPMSFYALRFLLGVAEAGFFPGIILYLTYWYPASRRAKMIALFMLAVPFANVIGGPLSGAILHGLSGTSGIPGWQWLFIMEAIPSLALGIIILCYLDDGIRQSKWLSEDEKQVLEGNLRREAGPEVKSSLGSAFADPKVWLLAAIYFMLNVGLYGIVFWMPTIIKGMGYTDTRTIGWISAIPYAVAVVAMVLVGRSGDRMRERRWHTAIPGFLGGLGLAFGIAFVNDPVLAMVGLSIGTAGMLASMPVFWCLPSAFLGGVAAAAGIAIMNSVGAFSGFIANFFIGWMKDLTGSLNSAMYLFAALAFLGGLLVFLIPGKLVNK
jgi:D-galactonate transporter